MGGLNWSLIGNQESQYMWRHRQDTQKVKNMTLKYIRSNISIKVQNRRTAITDHL